MRNAWLITMAAAFLMVAACKKNTVSTGGGTGNNANSIAPAGFNFATSRAVTINVQLMTNVSKPIPGVLVKFYDAADLANYNLDSDSGRNPIFSGITDASGTIQGQLVLDKNTDTLLIDPNFIGLARNAKAYFVSNSLSAVIGGPNNLSGNIATNLAVPGGLALHGPVRGGTWGATGSQGGWAQPTIQYFGGSPNINWGNTGVPTYLDPTSDEISANLLSRLNASIPENSHLPNVHPEYLTGTNPTDLAIKADADLYIGFLYAGTSQQNTVGYYTYPTNNPPTKPADITNIYFAFPNSDNPSFHGNQVVLTPGNRVHIGVVKAGTSIGFFCIPGGWGSGAITPKGHTIALANNSIYYSNPLFNPENDPSQATPTPIRHSVILNDAGFAQFVIGFEDAYSPNQVANNSGNNDYNDAVLYITGNPISSIDHTGVPPIANVTDADGDGVPDSYDAFPNDATRAYISYFPSQNGYGYVAFEDNWPLKGDYDMNDLVVKYQYKIISNAKNNVVEFYASYTPTAAGASFKNGFGVQFPFAPSQVATVTGQSLKNGYIKLNGNGTEAGQTNAVIIPFDNYNNLINNAGGAYFINTQANLPKVTGTSANIYVSFTSPISQASFGQAPFDMFAISNMRRAYEVHLPNFAPTDLADKKQLGTNDDASKPVSGIYYVSGDNWPWAMNFLQPFTYPVETVNVKDAYLHFLDWSKSGGVGYLDWYSNAGAGYTNPANLYNK